MSKRTGQSDTNQKGAVLPPPSFRDIPGLRADWTHVARMFFLEAIQQAVATKERYSGESWIKIGLRIHNRLPEKERFSAKCVAMLGAILDAKQDVSTNARRLFAEDFPEVAARLRDRDYVDAADVWRSTGGPCDDPKWQVLAEIMETAGLGVVRPESLKGAWKKWKRNRGTTAVPG